MPEFIKYLILYIIIYFIVDFTTGFNWDFNYWLSVNGHVMGAFVYTLSGLFFAYLIYRVKVRSITLFIVAMLYALLMEVIIFHNPLFGMNLLNAVIMMVGIYSLIVFAPKWITNRVLKKNILPFLVLLLFWLFLAAVALVNNPHA